MTFRSTLSALLFVAAIFGAVYLAIGQTTLAPRNLAPTIPNGVVVVIAPDGKVAFAQLDSSIQLSAGPSNFLTLRAVPTVTDRVVIFKPTAAGTTLTLPSDPSPNSLVVACNGLILSETEDYTRAARVLTFVPAHAPAAGYIYHIRYRE